MITNSAFYFVFNLIIFAKLFITHLHLNIVLSFALSPKSLTSIKAFVLSAQTNNLPLATTFYFLLYSYK